MQLPSNAKEATTLLSSALTTMERLVNYAETASWPAGSVTRAEAHQFADVMRRYSAVSSRLQSVATMARELVDAAGDA